MKKYRFMSLTTGEIVENILDVFKSIILNYRNFNFVDLKWKYNRNGF